MQESRARAADDRMAWRSQRFGVLFLSLLAAFWVLGVAPEGDGKRVIVTALLGTTLLLAFRVAYMPARRLRVATALVVIWVAGAAVAALAGQGDSVNSATAGANALLVVLAPPAVAIGIVRGFRERQVVTLAEVLGALCLYLLAGMFFAFVYSAIEHLDSGGFFTDGTDATLAKSLYYSFTTMTTVGYGDLTARTDFGHTLSATEALIGQIYLVTIVAVIVGNLRPRPRERS